jgi:hypothetical protein
MEFASWILCYLTTFPTSIMIFRNDLPLHLLFVFFLVGCGLFNFHFPEMYFRFNRHPKARKYENTKTGLEIAKSKYEGHSPKSSLRSNFDLPRVEKTVLFCTRSFRKMILRFEVSRPRLETKDKTNIVATDFV